MVIVNRYNVSELAQECAIYSDCPLAEKQGKYRMLMNDVQFELSKGLYLDIKKGFTWDENSIPFVLQFIFPKSGIYAVPALIHDALYYATYPDQEFADNEFKYFMAALGIDKRQIWFRYHAVRMFGGKWWRKNVNTPSKICIANRKLISIY